MGEQPHAETGEERGEPQRNPENQKTSINQMIKIKLSKKKNHNSIECKTHYHEYKHDKALARPQPTPFARWVGARQNPGIGTRTVGAGLGSHRARGAVRPASSAAPRTVLGRATPETPAHVEGPRSPAPQPSRERVEQHATEIAPPVHRVLHPPQVLVYPADHLCQLRRVQVL